MAKLLELSVVIPSKNRLERLTPLIRTYVEQGATELIVILDGPHPGWREQLRAASALPGVSITELPANRGLALARTAGLELATGDIVLIADDDVAPGPELVDRHRRFHTENPGHALLGYMPVALPAKRGRDQSATYIYARDYENQVAEWKTADSDALLRSFWGGNASISRELYLAAEAFKPSQRLNYNEDLDLGLRLAKVGAKATFDQRAEAAHLHSRSLTSFVKECVVRGEAVSDLERRWDTLPQQLVDLVKIPESHGRLEGRLQASIGERDSGGPVQGLAVIAYRVFGVLHAWRFQDAVTRFLRRGLAIRGYRLANSGISRNYPPKE